MNGLHLRLAAFQVAPWFFVNQTRNEMSGPVADAAKYIFRSSNITYSLRVPEKQTTGILLPNDTWTGVHGMLQSGAADFSVVPLPVEEEKLKYFYMFYPVLFTDFTILSAVTRKTKVFQVNIQPEIIYITIVLMVIVATVLTIINKRNGQNSETMTLWVKNFLTFFGTLTLQGPPGNVNGTARRLLMIFWLLPIVTLITTLVSLLISNMASVSYEFIDELKDFDKFPEICPTLPMGGHFQNIIETSSDESAMKVWKRIQECGGMVPLPEILSRRRFQDLIDKKIAILFQRGSLSYAVHAVCDSEKMLHIAPNQMETLTLNFFARKGFPWRLYEELNYRIMTYFETGIFLESTMRVSYRAERCLQIPKKPSSVITVDDLKIYFYGWFMGITISCVTLVLEIIYRMVSKRTGTVTVTFKDPPS